MSEEERRINHNIQNFFESIGENPELVREDGIDNRGYQRWMIDAGGKPLAIGDWGRGMTAREFVEWESRDQWIEFLRAGRLDYLETTPPGEVVWVR